MSEKFVPLSHAGDIIVTESLTRNCYHILVRSIWARFYTETTAYCGYRLRRTGMYDCQENVQHRIGSHHLCVEQRSLGQRSHNDALVPIRYLHHRCDTQDVPSATVRKRGSNFIAAWSCVVGNNPSTAKISIRSVLEEISGTSAILSTALQDIVVPAHAEFSGVFSPQYFRPKPAPHTPRASPTCARGCARRQWTGFRA